MDKLLDNSGGFTGAEIEKAIRFGIIQAFHESSATVKTKHFVDALTETKPLSQTASEQVQALRDWAKERFRHASRKTSKGGKKSMI
jgi:SpoVK/Ycf46/Vps4 family AAA+-type ATPase